jgi:thiol-disulfide isomerase/thioredoxin
MKILLYLILLLTTTHLKAQNKEKDAKELEDMISQAQQETAVLSAKYDNAEAAYEAAVNANKDQHLQDSLKAEMLAVHDELSAYDNRIQKLTLHFIATRPDSYVSATQLRSFVRILPLDTLQKLYTGLTPRMRESTPGKEIADEIRLIVAASVGSKAIDFKKADINNKPLQLSSFRGKVILLDFWASWCVPCRVGNPHLIALYNEYHNKGFTIIGIADDEKATAAWHKAIKKDKIGIWYHTLSGNLMHQFAVYSLPVKILIDRNGIIIGRYGSADGAALDKKLEEIL